MTSFIQNSGKYNPILQSQKANSVNTWRQDMEQGQVKKGITKDYEKIWGDDGMFHHFNSDDNFMDGHQTKYQIIFLNFIKFMGCQLCFN